MFVVLIVRVYAFHSSGFNSKVLTGRQYVFLNFDRHILVTATLLIFHVSSSYDLVFNALALFFFAYFPDVYVIS